MNLCFWQLYFKLFEMLLPARRKWSMQHFTLTAEVELGLFVLNVQFEYGTKFNPSKHKHIVLLNILKSRISLDATWVAAVVIYLLFSKRFEPAALLKVAAFSVQAKSIHCMGQPTLNQSAPCGVRIGGQSWKELYKRSGTDASFYREYKSQQRHAVHSCKVCTVHGTRCVK